MKRFQDYNLKVGDLPRGTKNAITDVAGVRVGHCTKIEGADVRTGVTIIDPGVTNLFRKKLPAAVAVGNGFGKAAGFPQIEECGTLEAPIALTTTLAIGTATLGLIQHIEQTNPTLGPLDSINVVVGEINDGRLNNIHQHSITLSDVQTACENISAEVTTGNVGAGTGARCFSWKGGIGTSSRAITLSLEGRGQGEGGKLDLTSTQYTLGALVLTNFGGSLTMMGVPVGKKFDKTDFQIAPQPKSDGSCIIVLATDAPLTARQLGRIARRTFLGLGRTGSVMNSTSGDFTIAFSTNRTGLEGSGEIGACLSDTDLTLFFLAAVDAVEESVYDALFAAETMTGRGGTTLEALPKDKILPLLRA